jgi:hypothetical protein
MPSATDWIAPWMQMCEIAATAPLVIGYRSARMLIGGWPPSARDRREYTRMWQEKVEAFTQAAMAAATRPRRSRAGPDPGASSGTRQRPAAVPRVSRLMRTARGRSARCRARSARQPGAHAVDAFEDHQTVVREAISASQPGL